MNPATLVSFGLLALIALTAVLTPGLAPDPHTQDLLASLQPPNAVHWLGTDHLGRDQLARLGEGLRTSLGLALASAGLAVALGSALGLFAAARGGWVDRALSVAADAVASIPGLLWVLLIAAIAPGQKWAIYSGLVLTAWVEFFRLMRSHTRSALLGQPVQAARLLGFGPAYIAWWYVLRPVAGVLARLWAYAVATAVLAIAALGFISVGLRPPQAELGLMMTEALPYYYDAPWLLGAPVVALVLVIGALQALVGRAADDIHHGVPT
ncbi:MAG: ABC transporter permease [Burkholderiaceae bacterium]